MPHKFHLYLIELSEGDNLGDKVGFLMILVGSITSPKVILFQPFFDISECCYPIPEGNRGRWIPNVDDFRFYIITVTQSKFKLFLVSNLFILKLWNAQDNYLKKRNAWLNI